VVSNTISTSESLKQHFFFHLLLPGIQGYAACAHSHSNALGRFVVSPGRNRPGVIEVESIGGA